MKKNIFIAVMALLWMATTASATTYQMHGQMVHKTLSCTDGTTVSVCQYTCGGGNLGICAEINVNDGFNRIVSCSPLIPSPSDITVGTAISSPDFTGTFISYDAATDGSGNTIYSWHYNAPTICQP